MRTAFDAVIAGAGPAGSAAAILLARAGWSVALIEKQCLSQTTRFASRQSRCRSASATCFGERISR